jgi:hypothetical protein
VTHEIIHGDARHVIPSLDLDPDRTVVITDPVWPNALQELAGSSDPLGLLQETLTLLIGRARRIVLVLGARSDLRFLRAVPDAWPWLRSCRLEYTVPSYAGTVLVDHDIACIFGDPARPHGGRRVYPGRCISNGTRKIDWHPCPRHLEHFLWLVSWFTTPDDLVFDPFAGSGTTILAAKKLGRSGKGIEVNATFAGTAQGRVDDERQGLLDLGGAA